jgi:hypothetical protein
MKNDRRSAPRARVNLPAHWEGVLFRTKATITDLSIGGCFVLSGGKVEVRELIYLEIELPHRRTIHVWAEVVDEASDIGFAVRFNSVNDEDQQILAEYIDDVFKSEPVKRSD